MPQPYYSLTREALIDAVVKHGGEVHDQVGPDTALVVLDADLMSDAHYREARNSLRFDTLRVKEAMRHLDLDNGDSKDQ